MESQELPSSSTICNDESVPETATNGGGLDFARTFSGSTSFQDWEHVWSRLASEHWGNNQHLLSDVVVYGTADEGDRLAHWLRACCGKHPGKFFAWSRDSDHFHILHDCPYSTRSCRCRWRQASIISDRIRRRLRRRPAKRILCLSIEDWKNIFIYFFLQEWVSEKEIWIRGTRWRCPTQDVSLQSLRSAEPERLVEIQNEGNGCERCEGLRTSSSVSESPGGRVQPTKAKRGRFAGFAEKISVLLKKYCCVPPEGVRDIIPNSSTEFDISLFDPRNESDYSAAIHVFKHSVNNLTFKSLIELLDQTIPVFYANSVNPFDYYMSREQSFEALMFLLFFQFGGETEIVSFLTNLQKWFDKIGWLDKDGNVNVKVNTIVVTGPPNSGKSFFFDCVASIALNVGHIGRVNNKTNNFALQDAVDRRLVVGNEICMEESAKDDFKKICEGLACNVRVKFKRDHVFYRTPVLLLSNDLPFVVTDPAFRERVRHFRWKQCSELKKYKLKPYPLALVDIFNHFNVAFL